MLQKNSEKFSDSFKRKFLIEFTKELIKNSAIKIQFQPEEEKIIDISREKPQAKIQHQKSFRNFPLRIPEPVFPETFRYLQPSPTQKEIDLGKLNPLIKDQFVKVIECNGEDEPIIVEGSMGRKPTRIILSKEEIDEIIRKFSEEGKIPAVSGIHRIVVGRLIFSAIISEIVSNKFIIRKMMFNLTPNQRKN